MTKKPTKVAGYIRVSSQIQVSEGESLSTQKQQIEDYAKSKNWDLVTIYADEGLSGSKIKHRTQLQQMIEDAKKGQFSIILFTKFSRFARNAREYHNLSHELKQHKVLLSSTKENIDPTTPIGKMVAGILALFAEWEHETIHEQMYENKMIRWREHRSFVGMPPLGYMWNERKKKLEINEGEARIYNRIVKMYIKQKYSLRDIAIKLNSEGLVATRLKKDGEEYKRAPWSPVTVGYILKNPAYYGLYIVNQYEYEDGIRGAGTKRTKRKKPTSETIEFPIPNLISKVRWDEIQKVIQFNKVKSKRSESTTEFFLRDSIICGRCGAKVKPRIGTKRKDGSTLRYYVCYWAGTSSKNLISAGRHKCSLPFIKAKSIENQIWITISMKFVMNPIRHLGKIFDPSKYKEMIRELEETIIRLNADWKLKDRSRDLMYKLKPDQNVDDYEIEKLKQMIRINRDEQLVIEDNLKVAESKLEEIKVLKNQEKELSKFLTNNKQKFDLIRKDINKLSLEDKKILVEAMLDGSCIVDYQEDDEIDGRGGPFVDCKFKYNTEILQRFRDEGKIKLDKNSPFDFTAIRFE